MEKTKSGEAEEKATGGRRGGTLRVDMEKRTPRAPSERRIVGNTPTKKQRLLAGREKREKKVSGRWRGGRARGAGETAVRRKRGEDERN